MADGVTLLPGEWTNGYPANILQTTQQLSKGLVTAALFARVYNLDPPSTTKSPTGKTASSPTGKTASSPTGKTASSPTGKTASSPTDPAAGLQNIFTMHSRVSSILSFIFLLLVHLGCYA